MQRFIAAFTLYLMGGFSFGQGIAPNWTLPDCNSVNHTLYTYLDSQEVVVMEFVMGCSSCTDAGTLLMNVKNYCHINYPGKGNFFLMDYYPTNDCSDVTTTWSTHNFDANFANCWAEKDFYYPTLYPMPAIVIAAGNYHTVIYNDLSWQSSDTTQIKQVIDHFFATVGIDDHLTKNHVAIYPNPSTDILRIDLSGIASGEYEGIEVYDSQGKPMKLIYHTSNHILVLSTGYFPVGNYILAVKTKMGTIRKTFIKN